MALVVTRVALVTGGSSGIGADLVRCLSAQGIEVWFTYRSGQQRAQELIASLPPAAACLTRAFEFDQGDHASLQRLLLALPPGGPDILINNAGLGTKTVEAYASERHLQDAALMQVNAVGVLWLTEALLPRMLARDHVLRGNAKIITISSVGGGITAFSGFRMADGMSKAALAHMSKQLAMELVHSPVDVFCVCPGATETPMFEASTLAHLDAPARAALLRALPKGRLIDPSEVAHLCLFLCSDAGRLLHGACLDASLGCGARPGLLTEYQGAPH